MAEGAHEELRRAVNLAEQRRQEGEAQLKANNAVEQDLSAGAVQRRRVMMAKLADCIAKFEAWLAELE